MRFLATLGVFFAMTSFSFGPASAQSQNLVGQWVTTVGGQSLTMTLNADGSADLMGTRGAWQAANGQIVISGEQGRIQGVVHGQQLVFEYNGQRFVWSRAAGGAAPAPPTSAPSPSGDLVGTWVTTYNGQPLTLTLRPDGSADLLGTPGTWSAGAGSITLRSAQGELTGAVQGGQMTFNINGQQFVYTRSGGAPATSAPAVTGKPFKPEKTLPGQKVTPDHTQMSMTMPKDWSGAWTQVGGAPIYAIQIAGMQGKAMIGASAKVLGPERNLPMPTLLQQGAMALWGQAAAGTPHLSETFTVHGHQAGRVIYRATVPHPATGQMVKAEGYLGIVLIDDWAFGFAGLYEEAKADTLRAGMDTLLASLDGTPPPRDRQMEARIAGCWESGTGTAPSSRSKGSAFTSAYLRIAANGTYTRKGGVSVRTPDLDPSKPERPEGSVSAEFGEQGTFMVHGSLITWMPNDGKGSYANLMEWKPGGLYLDKKLWINCI